MTSYKHDGKVGPWAREKLDCLQKYLKAYATILHKQEWCRGYFYVDAFAGSGRSDIRDYAKSETGESLIELDEISNANAIDQEYRDYVDGSPLVALRTEPAFTKCLFIEQNHQRANTLAARCSSEFDSARYTIKTGDANQELLALCRWHWNGYRAVAFVDPYAMQVEWSTVNAIARARAIEIIINLPMQTAVHRLLPREGAISTQNANRLNRFFGTETWQSEFYSSERTLFGEVIRKNAPSSKLLEFYRRNLLNIFRYVSDARIVRNTRGSPLYYLMHAGHNKTGQTIINDILNQGEAI